MKILKKFLEGIAILLGLAVMGLVGWLLLVVMFLAPFFLLGGTFYVTDPAEYEQLASLDYFPESIEAYTVNSYAYTRYEYLDTCSEVFLDLTVNETQFNEMIMQAKNHENFHFEQSAYYAEGYYEIVFYDYYTLYEGENVGWATIDKVIYNPETLNVIYESFHAHDSGVYGLNDVAYFNRFEIEQHEYVENMTVVESPYEISYGMVDSSKNEENSDDD